MKTIRITEEDIRTLIDVAEGYASEQGIEAVAWYADPGKVITAVNNARQPLSKAELKAP